MLQNVFNIGKNFKWSASSLTNRSIRFRMIYLTAFIKWYITDNRPRNSLRGQWYILSKISNQDPHSFSNLVSKSWTWLALSISQSQRQTGNSLKNSARMTQFNIIVFPFGSIRVKTKMTLVCHLKCHPLADYHQFTTRMIESIHVFRSTDRAYLFFTPGVD